MAANLDAVFRLRDQITRPLRRIREENRRTERELRRTDKMVDTLNKRFGEQDKVSGRLVKTARKVGGEYRTLADRLERARRQLDRMTESGKKNSQMFEGLQRTVATLERDLLKMSRRPHIIRARVVVNTKEAFAKLAALRAAMVGASKNAPRTNLLGQPTAMAWVAGIGTLIPVIATAVPLVQALGAGMAALIPLFGAVGAGALGATAILTPFIANVTKGVKAVNDAEDAIKNATTQQERLDAVKKLREVQAGLTAEQLAGVKAVRQFGREWSKIMKPIQADAARGIVGLIQTAGQQLGNYAPEMRAFGKQFRRTTSRVQGFLSDPKETALNKQALQGLPSILDKVATGLGNIFKIVRGLAIAATPLTNWLLDQINGWLKLGAATLSSADGIGKVRRWMVSMVPVFKAVGGLVKELWTQLGRLGSAVQPFLVPIINGVRALLRGLGDALVPIIETIGPKVGPLFQSIGQVLSSLGPAVATTVGTLVDALQMLLDLFNAIPAPIRNAATQITAFGIALKLLPVTSAINLGGALKTVGFAGELAFSKVGRSMTLAQKGMSLFRYGLATLGPGGMFAAAAVAGVGLGLVLKRVFSGGKSDSERLAEGTRKIADAARNAAAAYDSLRAAKDAALGAKIGKQQALLDQRRTQAALEKGRKDLKAGRISRDDFRQLQLDKARANAAVRSASADVIRTRQEKRETALKRLDSLGTVYTQQQDRLAELQRQRQRATPNFMNPGDPAKVKALNDQIRDQKKAIRETQGKIHEYRQDVGLMTKKMTEAREKAILLQAKLMDVGKPPDVTALLARFQQIADKATSVQAILVPFTNLISGVATNLAASIPGGANDPARPRARGGMEYRRNVITRLGEEGPEGVVPTAPHRRQEAKATMRALAARGVGGGHEGSLPPIVFQPGSVTINDEGGFARFEASLVSAINRARANMPTGETAEMYR